ncbi:MULTISPECIES: IS66 family transposase [Thiorhodovibrio]|uniref:IS66 family transposase n=1 Tax=Thiorhodovibrio TaxID=61593 RepID=UPI001913BB5E|nr:MULTISPECIES: IS66 family transposase [Thiorhodovibrio]MBK5969354.1 transposase [Thiorhodovibrio winogradskyi]WPL10451.1 Transposase [Thiorhodovibrio litoralis]
MEVAIQMLPNEPVQLHGIIHQLRAQLDALTQTLTEQQERIDSDAKRIDQLLEYIELLRRKRFGPSTDKVPDGQLNLFDETELEALIGQLEAEADAKTKPPKGENTKTNPPKGQPKRKPLPAHLTRVERILDLSEQEKAALGENWHFIGYDVSEQLADLPRQLYVIEYKRAKYAPVDDSVEDEEAGIKIAPRAPQMIPKAIAHASLLASIVTGKFVDALPLYRQEKIFAREGIDIPRQSMAGWLMQLQAPLAPIAQAIKAQLLLGATLNIDETRLQVLNEPGRDNTQESFIWVFCGGPPGRAVRWFEYATSRAAAVPHAVLFGEHGAGSDPPIELILQSDGYSAYHVLAKVEEIIDHAGCWAHVRRKFVEAGAGREASLAQAMVAMIGELYAIEKRLRLERADADTRVRERQAFSLPIIEQIKAWLDRHVLRVAPKSLLGKAIGYALNQWPTLLVFLDHGEVEIDNNQAENAIRPFVVGRKNWLFAGCPEGAQTSALLYSLIETAKANKLEPRAYLNHLFEQLPLAKTPQAIEALLPFNLRPEDLPAPARLASITDPAVSGKR